MKYLLIGGLSSSILAYGFSWLYGLFGGEIQLQKIANGIISTEMYNSSGNLIALIFIINQLFIEMFRFFPYIFTHVQSTIWFIL